MASSWGDKVKLKSEIRKYMSEEREDELLSEMHDIFHMMAFKNTEGASADLRLYVFESMKGKAKNEFEMFVMGGMFEFLLKDHGHPV